MLPATGGRFLRKPNVKQRHLDVAIERAGVTKIRFHDLRHTHATQLLFDGVGLQVVSERLGHDDIATTIRYYSHVLPSQDTTAAASIDAMLG